MDSPVAAGHNPLLASMSKASAGVRWTHSSNEIQFWIYEVQFRWMPFRISLCVAERVPLGTHSQPMDDGQPSNLLSDVESRGIEVHQNSRPLCCCQRAYAVAADAQMLGHR